VSAQVAVAQGAGLERQEDEHVPAVAEGGEQAAAGAVGGGRVPAGTGRGLGGAGLLLFYCGYPFQHQILDDCSIDFVFLSEIFRSHSLCR
jgi:hypothetical protein